VKGKRRGKLLGWSTTTTLNAREKHHSMSLFRKGREGEVPGSRAGSKSSRGASEGDVRFVGWGARAGTTRRPRVQTGDKGETDHGKGLREGKLSHRTRFLSLKNRTTKKKVFTTS